MARPRIPTELKKLHWRNYIAVYRQREKNRRRQLSVYMQESTEQSESPTF